MFDFGNLITAMVTPFTDTLEVDYKRMQDYGSRSPLQVQPYASR